MSYDTFTGITTEFQQLAQTMSPFIGTCNWKSSMRAGSIVDLIHQPWLGFPRMLLILPSSEGECRLQAANERTAAVQAPSCPQKPLVQERELTSGNSQKSEGKLSQKSLAHPSSFIMGPTNMKSFLNQLMAERWNWPIKPISASEVESASLPTSPSLDTCPCRGRVDAKRKSGFR